jgi:hypothetical protein
VEQSALIQDIQNDVFGKMSNRCIFTMDLTIPVALQASQPVGGQGHKQIERFIYNFIKHFGSSIGAGNNIQMLKLEELNVRKCIQLEIL